MPETRFARASEIDVAYQVTGAGPPDIVMVPGWFSHLDVSMELPEFARFQQCFEEFARIIRFDKRGMGLSDRTAGLSTIEERIDDVIAVPDAVGLERAALVGWADGAAMLAVFAATHPDRVSALVLCEVTAKVESAAKGAPWGIDPGALDGMVEAVRSSWGDGLALPFLAPSVAGDERFQSWWRRYERSSATPNAAATALRTMLELDVRAVLPFIRVPTLVLHRRDAELFPSAGARWFAQQIPGARYVEVPGADTLPYVGDSAAITAEIEEFLTGAARHTSTDRVLATVIFTDIVGSTERAAAIGDRRWRDLLAAHHAQIRETLPRFGAREVDLAGDGFLITCDGPARAIRCAVAMRDAVRSLGLQIRAGIHTGEIELHGSSVSGLAVHLGARVAALAGANEVLVTRTVKDLVIGSGIDFVEAGTHVLKGVPDSWPLWSVAAV